MPHSELRLLGAYRDPLKLTLELITPIYDTRLCLGTITTLTLPYIEPYSPYSALQSTQSSPSTFRVRNRSAYCCLVGTVGYNVG